MTQTATRPFDEFVGIVTAMYGHPTNRKRLGDLFFHVLHSERPDVAQEIVGTLFDPSGRDQIHSKVISRVRELWG